MPKGNSLRNTGGTVHTRHTLCPCGKKYSGTAKKVNMLVRMHKKKCEECRECEVVKTEKINTNGSFDNSPLIQKVADEFDEF
jgi:polyferredoxin